jgi:hypothetical protein
MFEWLNLKNLSPYNYGDQILKSVIVSKYAKEKLTIILMTLITSIIRFHIISILSIAISFNLWLDFIIQIPLTVIISINSHLIYRMIEYYQPQLYKLTKYIINNYSFENYRRWKRIFVFIIAAYIISLLFFIKINSNMIIIYIIQYIIIYGIIDLIEQKQLEEMVYDIYNKPNNIIYGEVNIKKDYCEISQIEEKQEALKDQLNDTHEKKGLGFMIIDNFRNKKEE